MAFGRELKDFVEAFKAGSSVAQGAARLALQDQQIKSTAEYRKATMDLQGRMHGDRIALGRDQLGAVGQRHSDMMKFRERSLGASQGFRQQQLGLARDRLDLLRQQSPVGQFGAGAAAVPVAPSPHATPAPAAPATPPAAPARTPVGALPVDDAPDLAAIDPQDDAFAAMGALDDDEDEAQAARRGGMIRSFEDGGYIEEDDYGDDEDSGGDEDYIEGGGDGDVGSGYDPAGGAIPSQVTPQQAPAQQRAANTTDLPAGMALHGAVSEIQRNIPQRAQGAPGAQPQGAIPAQRDPVSGNFHQFIPKFSDQDYGEFMKTIDPDNKLGPAVREIAGIKAIYDFYLRQGDVQKAEQAAAAMVMRASEHSMRYGAAAEQAIRGGQFKQGAELLRQSYDNVPDGRSAEAEVDDSGRGMLVLKDTQGNVISRNPFGPQQMLMAATGMKNGSLFWQELTGAAHRYLGNTGQPTKAYQDAISGLMKDPPAASAVPASATRPEAAPASTAAGEDAPEEAIPTSKAPTLPQPFDPNKVNVAGMRPVEATDYRAKAKTKHDAEMGDFFQRAAAHLDTLTPQVKNTGADDEDVRPTITREQQEYLTQLAGVKGGAGIVNQWRRNWEDTQLKPWQERQKEAEKLASTERLRPPKLEDVKATSETIEREHLEPMLFKNLVHPKTGKPIASMDDAKEAFGAGFIRSTRDIATNLSIWNGVNPDTAVDHTTSLLSTDLKTGEPRYRAGKPDKFGNVRLALPGGDTLRVPQDFLPKIEAARTQLAQHMRSAQEAAQRAETDSAKRSASVSGGLDDIKRGVGGVLGSLKVGDPSEAVEPPDPNRMTHSSGVPLVNWMRNIHSVDPNDPNLSPDQRRMLELSNPPAALPGVPPRR